ncbi:maltose regulon periplasmic protein [Vibrio aerogenes CECT 7868]|uniref:Maltose regulon periplasmic protein n=1 Tax=Vibrio aerogenes CECT 7868 TaxID=1216006 RepID=A0A1M5UXU4_9VIBR|nr:MalM family protein [Vibrio aerogenes]SHH67704.1 maltose regulon periplasmic protein [Vibrio aerogenes CECT 7868]
MNKAFSTFMIGLTVSGCSSVAPPDSHSARQSLSAAQICCSAYAGFYWTEVNKNDPIRLKLNQRSPVWSFPEGNSYFGAFHFSELSGEVSVNIRSTMSTGQVFAPTVLLLDAHFQPRIKWDLTHFEIRYADAFGQNRYEGRFNINAEETPYMVIYTNAEKIGDKVIIPHPAKRRAKESGEPLPIVSDISYARTYQGTMDIQVTTESVRQHPVTPPSPQRHVQDTRVVEADSTHYYHHAIQQAVANHHIDKALALLEEAKILNVPKARQVFIEAINKETVK